MSEERTGTVEKIEYTQGGFGNQFTTISGVRYWTWWDVRTTPVCIGARVAFRAHLNAVIADHPRTVGDIADSFRVADRPLPAICEAIERKAGYPRANPEPVPYCWAHKVAHTLRADGQYRCPHCGATYHAYMIDSTGKVTPVRQ